MNTKNITKIALMSSILFVVFRLFSNIIYVEGITFVICLFACVFDKKEAIYSSLIFAIVNMLIQGITIWSFMYVVIYPLYSFIVYLIKKHAIKKLYIIVGACGFLSFLTGQLLELPFLLISKDMTMLYIIMGLKTSIIQGCISAFLCLLLFNPCYNVLTKINNNIIK